MKEEARKLIEKFIIPDAGNFAQVSRRYTKKCALIALDLVIESHPNFYSYNLKGEKIPKTNHTKQHYIDLKKEVENLC